MKLAALEEALGGMKLAETDFRGGLEVAVVASSFMPGEPEIPTHLK